MTPKLPLNDEVIIANVEFELLARYYNVYNKGNSLQGECSYTLSAGLCGTGVLMLAAQSRVCSLG